MCVSGRGVLGPGALCPPCGLVCACVRTQCSVCVCACVRVHCTGDRGAPAPLPALAQGDLSACPAGGPGEALPASLNLCLARQGASTGPWTCEGCPARLLGALAGKPLAACGWDRLLGGAGRCPRPPEADRPCCPGFRAPPWRRRALGARCAVRLPGPQRRPRPGRGSPRCALLPCSWAGSSCSLSVRSSEPGPLGVCVRRCAVCAASQLRPWARPALGSHVPGPGACAGEPTLLDREGHKAGPRAWGAGRRAQHFQQGLRVVAQATLLTCRRGSTLLTCRRGLAGQLRKIWNTRISGQPPRSLVRPEALSRSPPGASPACRPCQWVSSLQPVPSLATQTTSQSWPLGPSIRRPWVSE